MAPTAPPAGTGKRPTARQKAAARLADPLLPRKLHRSENVVSDSFINSKRDKRTIKHSAFVSKINSTTTSSSRISKTPRRRPSKKLVTTLDSLTDALDDIKQEIAQEEADKPEEGKIRHKSLKSRPGALKRKEKVVRGEMERFGRNLAQLAAFAESLTQEEGQQQVQQQQQQKPETTAAAAAATAPTSSRWAALRGFITSTMEQNPAFVNKS
ncbi:ribosome biogenesis protein SLX9-domain-containing protein [Cladorrhinum sp. PSN332]|nr:ribosome biogenesis protein SLX9-domain-containing protein [Cladorrhinum sp. PSN332]